MTLTAIATRVRNSLFLVPMVFIVGSGVLSWLALELDRTGTGGDLVFLLPTSVAGARAVLGTIAGATITVAALVFSLTAITVQLAASQYSPRVLSEFLRDRFQQTVVGIVVGTFTFSLISLSTIGDAGSEAPGVTAAWATTIATVLAVCSVVGIVAFIDRVTTRLSIDDTVRRIASDTSREFAKLFTQERVVSAHDGSSWALSPGATSQTVAAPATGWIQRIDPERILSHLAPGQIARVEARVGRHVVGGEPIITVWTAVEPGPEGAATTVPDIAEALTIGEFRTVSEDPGFGLRQLIDIALRALSPGVNDPTTAGDVLHQLVEPFRIVLLGHPRPRVRRGSDGRLVALPEQRDRADYVRSAFGEIRLAMQEQPHVAAAMASSLLALRRLPLPVDAAGALDEQYGLLSEAVRSWALPEADTAAVDRVLEQYREAAGL